MTSGINGRCDCPLGRHHKVTCPNYIEVWRTCPCPECLNLRLDARTSLPTLDSAATGQMTVTHAIIWSAVDETFEPLIIEFHRDQEE